MSHYTRREFLHQVAGAAAAASLSDSLLGQTTAPSQPKRNVLFIMSDDMRVELGCYNSMFGAITPNIDALAKSGVRFDRNYCQFPLCNPSRTSMLTGRHPVTTRVLGNGASFRTAHPDWITLPQHFKNNGYHSMRTGKIFHGGNLDDPQAWGEIGRSNGSGSTGGHSLEIPPQEVPPQPPDVLPPLPADISQKPNSDRVVILDGNGEANGDFGTAEGTIEFLNKYKDQPFFIGCGFVKPHSPPSAPQKFLDMYDPEKIQLTPDFEAWPTVPPGFPKGAIRMLNADLFIGRGASRYEAKRYIQGYLASISWADWNVGRVIAELDRLGLRQNTIIVFAVDHGYQLGEKGKWSKAGSLFEMGCRTPFIISAPGMKGNGQSCTRIVQSVDLYPTMLELCGLPKPEGLEGTSLLPLLNNPQAEFNEPAYSVWSEDGRTLHGVGVRNERYRYAEFGPNGSGGAMLFDEREDPLEMKNLANDPQHAAVCAELSSLTKKYAARMGTA
jgi:arylsulfatase A-like enzyme